MPKPRGSRVAEVGDTIWLLEITFGVNNKSMRAFTSEAGLKLAMQATRVAKLPKRVFKLEQPQWEEVNA